MPVKRILLILLIMLTPTFFPAYAAASEEKPRQTGIFFMRGVNEEELRDVNALVFSDVVINGHIRALIVSVGGEIEVNGAVDGIILSLFTKTVSTGNIKYGIINLKYLSLPFDLIIGLAALALSRDFIGQAAAYFYKSKRSVLKFGLYGYLMALVLIGVYFISVSGAVLALAGIAGLCAVTALGHVPAAVALGLWTLKPDMTGNNIYLLFAVGIVIINFIKLIPLLGDAFALAVMPALSLGIFSVYIVHKYFYRAYVDAGFGGRAGYGREKREKIKALILTPRERGGGKGEQ